MTTLTITVPGQPTLEVKLERERHTLGRAPDNDIVIDTPVVSRHHAVFERSAEGWTCTDLNSSNGTRLNGNRIQKIPLKDGMHLVLGKDPLKAVTLTFQLTAQAKVPPKALQEAQPVQVTMPEGLPPRTGGMDAQTRQGPSDTCPRCHVPLRADAHFCPSCGYNLTPGRSDRTIETASVAILPEFVVHDEQGDAHSTMLSKPVMSVGRAPDNDIVLKSKLVSNHHLQVDIQAGQVKITDLNSTNGTQVNGTRIPAGQGRVLNPGDVIRIGDLTGNSLHITYGGTAGGGLRTKEVEKLDLGKLKKQPSILIGRSSSCDMCMAHPNVSKHHAMITRDQNGISIRDLGSSNGTFVNGVRITQVGLRDGDEIQIGPFSLVYDGRLQNLAGAQRLGHRLDAIHLVKQVKGGFIILNNVSLSVQASEFIALVGGSGAGKSTLMKAMNGYEPATKGQLLIDGEDLYSRLDMYRTEMGYVPQDDIIHRVLPVRLALWYAAKLRLPDASGQEVQKSIDDALKAVDMTEHQNKRVRDLSGGQRKRVSIASELLAQPTLFFLDEPTSGLDPGLEKKMMYDLKRLADQGRTIVLVTHATTNIEQCDFVAFMAKGGRLAYYGPPREAITFFEAQDFPDIYQKLSFEIDPGRGAQPPPELTSDYQHYIEASSGPAERTSGKVSAGILWAERFRKSPVYQKYIAGRQAAIGGSQRAELARRAAPVRSAKVSFIQQTWILARRNFDLIRHDMRTMLILLAMLPLIGLLFGVVSEKYWFTGKGWETRDGTLVTANFEQEMKADLKDEPVDASNTYTPYQDASMLVMMIALALTQGGTFGASYEIVKERPIFQRERAVNLSVWSYVLSKVAVLSMFAIVQVGGTLLLLGMLVNLGVEGIFITNFSLPEIFITLYLAVLSSIGLGLLISAMVPSTDVVLYVILAELFLQIVLSGTLFPMPSNPASYVTPGYWATDGLSSIVDLPRLDKEGIGCKVVEIPSMTGGPASKDVVCDSASSNKENLESYKHTPVHLMVTWIAMGTQLIVWVLLTILVQSRKKAGKD